MKKIYFVTSNKGKVKEAKEKFSQLGIELIQKNIGYPELQVDTLEEVALYGVDDIKKRFDKPFILEDAGLFINALDGFPGVYSAYVFRTIGCPGIIKLMENVKNSKRTAKFRSVYAYYDGKKYKLFIGESAGTISKKIIGNNGFGYDPIFIPNGKKKTFGQMDINEKNLCSHRGKALQKLMDFFNNNK